VQVILLGYAATTDIKNSTLVVCDLDRTEESREFIRGFTNTAYFIGRYAVEAPGAVDPIIEDGGRASDL